MSLARARPSFATGVELAGVVLFCWRRERRSPLIRLSTRRSGGVEVRMPGLSGRNFSGSGVRRRERLVLETARRPGPSRILGVDWRDTGALSDTLRWPATEAEEAGAAPGAGVGVESPRRAANPAPAVTAAAAAPTGVRAPYCFRSLFSGSGVGPGVDGSLSTGVPRGERRSFRSLLGSGVRSTVRSGSPV